jgi:hypothetical protein
MDMKKDQKKPVKKPVKPDTPCGVLCQKFMLDICGGNDISCEMYVKFLDDTEQYLVEAI